MSLPHILFDKSKSFCSWGLEKVLSSPFFPFIKLLSNLFFSLQILSFNWINFTSKCSSFLMKS
uniref:Uncharacterized protein n=1 Tax=Rhizophora mucronata TaxID=61149 RepID=A0A2P2PIT4_RHIMU